MSSVSTRRQAAAAAAASPVAATQAIACLMEDDTMFDQAEAAAQKRFQKKKPAAKGLDALEPEAEAEPAAAEAEAAAAAAAAAAEAAPLFHWDSPTPSTSAQLEQDLAGADGDDVDSPAPAVAQPAVAQPAVAPPKYVSFSMSLEEKRAALASWDAFALSERVVSLGLDGLALQLLKDLWTEEQRISEASKLQKRYYADLMKSSSVSQSSLHSALEAATLAADPAAISAAVDARCQADLSAAGQQIASAMTEGDEAAALQRVRLVKSAEYKQSLLEELSASAASSLAAAKQRVDDIDIVIAQRLCLRGLISEPQVNAGASGSGSGRKRRASGTRSNPHANGSGGGTHGLSRSAPERYPSPLVIVPSDKLASIASAVTSLRSSHPGKLGPANAVHVACGCYECAKDPDSFNAEVSAKAGRDVDVRASHGETPVINVGVVVLGLDGSVALSGVWTASTPNVTRPNGPEPLKKFVLEPGYSFPDFMDLTKVDAGGEVRRSGSGTPLRYSSTLAKVFHVVFGSGIGLCSDFKRDGGKFDHNLWIHIDEAKDVIVLVPNALETPLLLADVLPGFSSVSGEVNDAKPDAKPSYGFLGNRDRVSGGKKTCVLLFGDLGFSEDLFSEESFACFGKDGSPIFGVYHTMWYNDPHVKLRNRRAQAVQEDASASSDSDSD